MDKNKVIKRHQIGYKLQPTCGTCHFAELSEDGWGTCRLHLYVHLKHTGEPRQLSIHQFGVCRDYACDLPPDLLALKGSTEEG